MVTKEAILPLINARLNRLLLIAQAALPEHQFEAFRRLILDEFGRAGLIRDLYEKEKKTVLMVTHDRDLAKMATKVWNIVTGDWEKK